MPKNTIGGGPSNALDPIDAPARDHLLNSVPAEVWHLVNELMAGVGQTYTPTPLSGPQAAAAALNAEVV